VKTNLAYIDRTLYLNDLYQMILPIAGCVYVVGEDYQSDLSVLSDLRDIYSDMRLVSGTTLDNENVVTWLEDNPQEIVSLCCLRPGGDVAPGRVHPDVHPDRLPSVTSCLKALIPHLMPGSIVSIDHFGSDPVYCDTNMTMAVHQVFGSNSLTWQRSHFCRSSAFAVIP